MSDLQVDYTRRELLQSHAVAEPLVAGGVRCHGGFDDAGTYVSPRTKHRWPAIRAWQQQRAAQFGTPLLDMDLDTWPGAYPNVAQAKFLLRSGVTEPIVGRLTQIGTVEGFGAMIRQSPIPDLEGVSSKTSAARRRGTSAAACTRRTPVTRPATRLRAATSRCGSQPATSPSSTP